MVYDDDRSFADKMQALRDKYIARLSDTHSIIQPIVERLAAGTATSTDRAGLEACAHKLSGTGASYGFPAISETACGLEDALRDGVPGARIVILADALLKAMAEAT